MFLIWLVIGLLFVAAVWFVMIYNGLVGKRNRVEEAESSIDVMLTKRFDLIPNLVSTVERYMEHEQDTLAELTALRAEAMSGGLTSERKAEIDQEVSGALGRLMVSVESYPDLKASENFLQLQRSLNEVEEQLSAARRTYNAQVTTLNTAIESFPSNIVADMMSLERRPFYEAEAAARATPDVGALFDRE